MIDSKQNKRTRLMLVGGHDYLRGQARTLIAREGLFEIVAEIENGVLAVSEARRLRPDLILMDVLLPDSNGLSITSVIKRLLPASHVVLMIGNAACRQAALKSGVTETVLKHDLPATLIVTLKQAGAQRRDLGGGENV